jgi:hypothetical protein
MIKMMSEAFEAISETGLRIDIDKMICLSSLSQEERNVRGFSSLIAIDLIIWAFFESHNFTPHSQ